LPGYNVRPGELHGCVGIEQLKKLPDMIAQRRENARLWKDLFRGHAFVSIQEEIGKSSWFGFAMVIKQGAHIKRNELVEALIQNGIECRPIVAGNFVKNPVIQILDHDVSGSLEGAEHIHVNGLFIGNHHFDIKSQLLKVKAVVDGVFEKNATN